MQGPLPLYIRTHLKTHCNTTLTQEALTTLQEDYHTEQAEKAANFKARHQAKDAGSRNGTPQKAPHPSSPAKAGSRPQSARHTSVHTPSKMTAGQQVCVCV